MSQKHFCPRYGPFVPVNRNCERDVLDRLDVSLYSVSIKAHFSCNAVDESISQMGSALIRFFYMSSGPMGVLHGYIKIEFSRATPGTSASYFLNSKNNWKLIHLTL